MPSAIVVVFHGQLYADVVSVQTSTQSVVPLGAYWNLTLATPRFEPAVADSVGVPVSGVLTVPSETVTVLKSAAAPIVVGEVDFAVKSAPDDTTPPVATPITASSTSSARLTPPPPAPVVPPRRRAGATGGKG